MPIMFFRSSVIRILYVLSVTTLLCYRCTFTTTSVEHIANNELENIPEKVSKEDILQDAKYRDSNLSDEEVDTNTDPLDAYEKHLNVFPDKNLRILTESLEKPSEKLRGDYPVLNFLKDKFLITKEARDIERVHLVHMALAERLANFPDLKTKDEELYNLYVEALDVYKNKILDLFSDLREDRIIKLYTSRGDHKYIYILLPQGQAEPRKELIEFWIKNIVIFVRLRAHGKLRHLMEVALCSGPNDVIKNLKELRTSVQVWAQIHIKVYHDFLFTFLKYLTDEQTKGRFQKFIDNVEKLQPLSNPSSFAAKSTAFS